MKSCRDEVIRGREEIYNEIVRTLTNYEIPEDEDHKTTEEDLYLLLVKIQNRWEDTITAEV